MVKDDIGNDVDPRLVESIDGCEVFILRAVLRGDASFLIELTQVIHVVDAVSNVLAPLIALVRGGKPNSFNPQLRKVVCRSSNRPPQALISRQIPCECLQKQMIVEVLRLCI